jgi:hypothetical protein
VARTTRCAVFERVDEQPSGTPSPTGLVTAATGAVLSTVSRVRIGDSVPARTRVLAIRRLVPGFPANAVLVRSVVTDDMTNPDETRQSDDRRRSPTSATCGTRSAAANTDEILDARHVTV